MERRGALIVLEGLDRSGKSSQCRRLVSFLSGLGISVEAWGFPDRHTAIGGAISSFLSGTADLDDRAVHLLFSANRWEKRHKMESQLMSGTTLVVDRYSYSGVAFSAAKGLDPEWCMAPETGLPAADVVFYLDIPPEEAATRGGYGEERYERLDFQKKVASQYKALRSHNWRVTIESAVHSSMTCFQVVDATLPFDMVHSLMREASLKVVSRCQNGLELSRLWQCHNKTDEAEPTDFLDESLTTS